MMAGTGWVAPLGIETEAVNEALFPPSITVTEMLLVLTVPVTDMGGGGFGP